MIPLSLLLGVLSGMREGSTLDRSISFVSILTTSVPEFASATFLVALFVFKLGWLPGTSSMTGGFNPVELILPVAVLVLYDFGYVTRMTRASMAEVMTSQYIRTAVLKGLPRKTVIVGHALRNALIAPFTVIVLQLNWLLSGVIVVEVFFAYRGFGKLLYDARHLRRHLPDRGLHAGGGVRRRVLPVHLRRRLHPAQPADQVQLMASTVATQTPAAPSRLGSFFGALGLLRESPIGMLGAAILLFWVTMAILAPVLPLHDPNQAIAPFQKIWATSPKGDFFPLGTDHKGRDILSRLIWGSQRVLIWATLATAVAYVVGMLMGVAAGYLGGWWDEILSFIGNVLLSFPVMVLYIIIISNLGSSGLNIVLAVTFASAPGIMRIVRGLVLDLKTRDYIFAAQTRGESPWRIMLVELLPNARGPLIVDACLRLGYTVITIATLGFLGLGLPPPDPDWGQMIAEAVPVGVFAIHAMLIPALAVSSLVLGFNLLADGLREISLKD